jgi:hypothetical protein
MSDWQGPHAHRQHGEPPPVEVEQPCHMELPVETAFEHCPLCGSDLSQIKFHEIQLKLQDDEKKKSAKLADAELAIHRRIETQLKKEFEERNRAAEQRVKDEAEKQVKKIAAERDQAAKQLKEAQLHEIEVRKQTQLEIEKQKKAAEKQIRQEIAQQLKNVAAERDQAAKKLKEAQEREIESRKQVQIEIEDQRQAAVKKAKEEAEQQIKKVASERDQFAQKLKETQAREEEVRTKALKEAAEKWQKDAMLQRQALENDKTVALLKLQSDFNRQTESIQKKMRLMENQLKKKTANELGDGAEIDLYEALREAYQGDNIRRIPKGQAGADILHVVLYKGESCGSIITDSKNHQGWQNGFVTKLRQDQLDAGAEHAILSSTVFPAGKKELCIESGVIVVSPARVVYITQLLRQAMIAMHIKGLSLNERSNKMSSLYKLITSESHAKKFNEASRLSQDILDLDASEKKEHDNVWRKRGTLATRIKNVLREVEIDIAAVIESRGDGSGDPPVIAIDRVASSASISAPIERTTWNKP